MGQHVSMRLEAPSERLPKNDTIYAKDCQGFQKKQIIFLAFPVFVFILFIFLGIYIDIYNIL